MANQSPLIRTYSTTLRFKFHLLTTATSYITLPSANQASVKHYVKKKMQHSILSLNKTVESVVSL
jgi:hypothetical protein